MTKSTQRGTRKHEQASDFEVTAAQIELLARRLLPEIKRFFANEDIRREFEEWQRKRHEGADE